MAFWWRFCCIKILTFMEGSLFSLCDFYIFLRKSLPILRRKKEESLVFSLSFIVALLPTLDYQWFTAEWKAEKNDFIYLSSCERQARKKKCHFTHNSLVLICKAGLKCLLFLWVLYNSTFVSLGLSAYFNCKSSG